MLVLSQTIVRYLYTVYVYCGNECFNVYGMFNEMIWIFGQKFYTMTSVGIMVLDGSQKPTMKYYFRIIFHCCNDRYSYKI